MNRSGDHRRRRAVLAGAALLAAPSLVRAQGGAQGVVQGAAWSPTRPVRFVVAFPPGGASDVAARWLARELAPRLGQPVLVENRPGANGIVGSGYVGGAAPDGHTLIFTTADTHSVNPFVYRRLPYRPADFVPVTPVARLVFSLATRPGFGARDVPAFVEAARRAPNPVTFASWGVASTSQIMMETFRGRHGLAMQHVPYQGAAPAIAGMLADQVDCMMVPIGLAVAQGGRLPILGAATAQRFPGAPDVPTFTEQGEPLVGDLWMALLAPPGTPAAVVERVHAEVHAIVASPEAGNFLVPNGLIPDPSDRPAFLAYLGAEDAVWRERVERLGIRLDE